MTETTSPTPLERAQGCLVGLALGDALGSPYEFQATHKVDATAFHRGVFGHAPGHPTDDSTLAGFLAEALVHGQDIRDAFIAYGQKLAAWAASGPLDIGGQTAKAARYLEVGQTPPKDDKAQGNGSLMAIAALAIYGATALEVDAFTNLTHPSKEARKVNRSFVALLRYHLEGYAPWPIDPPITLSTEKIVGGPKGWCWVAYSLAHQALAMAEATSPFEALVWVIGRGGDTDTNGAIVGAALGAAYGLDWMPPGLILDLAVATPMMSLGRALHNQ